MPFLQSPSQIIAEAESLIPSRKKALKTFKAKALQTAKVIGRASLRLGVRVATAGVVEGEALEKTAGEIAKDFGDETTKVIDEVLKERLESQNSDRKVFESFKEALTQLADALSQTGDGDSKGRRVLPLVFIIDELDRCRPTFALEIIEKVKHFFSVPRVIFLLVSSLSQLESAVHFAYGDIDAHTYLEKFYHLRVLFPVGRPGRPNLEVRRYLQDIGCKRNFTDLVEQFSNVYPLSLRTLQRIAAYYKMVEVSVPTGVIVLPEIVVILCILKVIKRELYEGAGSSKEIWAEARTFLRFDVWHDQNNTTQRSTLSEMIEKWWAYCLGKAIDEETTAAFDRILVQSNILPQNIILYFCELIDGFAFPDKS
jgi:hypothetical protein